MLKDVTIGRMQTTVATGCVVAVDADTISVSIPVRAVKLDDGSWKDTEVKVISKTDAKGNPIGDYTVGQPFVGFIGKGEDDATYVADEVLKDVKVKQFTNNVKSISTGDTRKHNDAVFTSTLTKATQVMVNEEKKCVTVPFNQMDGEPAVMVVWKDNPKSNYGPHWADTTNKDGKTVAGLATYAKRLKERLERLGEDEVLHITYCGRFETGQKQADGSWKNVPCQLQEGKDGKQVYTLFASSESSLGDIQKYAFSVSKAYAVKNKFEGTKSAPAEYDHSYSNLAQAAPKAPAQTTAPAPAVNETSLAEAVADEMDDESILNEMVQSV